MKRSITLFFLFCGLFLISLNAQEILYFDFGPANQTTSGNWNNIPNYATTDAAVTLINSTGATTSYSFVITDDFYSGYNYGGTLAPTAPAVNDFPDTSTKDNIFGFGLDWSPNPANPSGAFTISGLNSAKYYSITFFASRTGATDNREALYTIKGSTADIAVALDGANNVSNVVTAYNAQPTSEGVLTVKVEAGPNNTNSSKFFYLGAMKMVISDTPLTTSFSNISRDLNITYADGTLSLGDYTGVVNIYNVTGKLVSKREAMLGCLKVNLQQGLYIVKAGTSTSKLIVK